MAESAMLPEEFADLEPFAPVWALADMNDRYDRRLASSMDEMQAYYDALVPRGEAAIAYLDQFELDDMPETALNLFWMLCSLSAVGFPIDIFKTPRVPDSSDARLDWSITPVP